MPVRSPLLYLLLLSFSICGNAHDRRFVASLEDSRWTLTEDSLIECRIEHQIPQFGSAIFKQEAGRGLQFELTTRNKIKPGIKVELSSETTSWNQRDTRAALARFETNGTQSVFPVTNRIAERVFYELGSGYQPGFFFFDEHPLVAILSTVRFGEVEAAFKQCVGRLYALNFNDVRVSSIHFEHDQEFASIEDESTAFTGMLDYLQIDDGIAEVVVNGHTDKSGLACYNEGLSERRAWYVYDLLIASGVDAEMLRVDYFGEFRPTTPGDNKTSLAANRRVTVELRR